MKNALKLLFSSLLALPLTMYAQQQSFPEGTVPNEHNINGAEYPYRRRPSGTLQSICPQCTKSRNQLPR
jgi:hypothetical protein